ARALLRALGARRALRRRLAGRCALGIRRGLELLRDGRPPLLGPGPQRLVVALGRHLVVVLCRRRPPLLLLHREAAAGQGPESEGRLERFVGQRGLKRLEGRRVALEAKLALAEKQVALGANGGVAALDGSLGEGGGVLEGVPVERGLGQIQRSALGEIVIRK